MVEHLIAAYGSGGLSLVVIITLGSVVVYLYRDLRRIEKRAYQREREFTTFVVRLNERLRDSKKNSLPPFRRTLTGVDSEKDVVAIREQSMKDLDVILDDYLKDD